MIALSIVHLVMSNTSIAQRSSSVARYEICCANTISSTFKHQTTNVEAGSPFSYSPNIIQPYLERWLGIHREIPHDPQHLRYQSLSALPICDRDKQHGPIALQQHPIEYCVAALGSVALNNIAKLSCPFCRPGSIVLKRPIFRSIGSPRRGPRLH